MVFIIEVKGPFSSFKAFDGRRASPRDLQLLVERNSCAPVLVESTKDPEGTKVVTAECAWKGMETDTSRERKDERKLGRDFETNLPSDREDDVWSCIFDRSKK